MLKGFPKNLPIILGGGIGMLAMLACIVILITKQQWGEAGLFFVLFLGFMVVTVAGLLAE